MLLKAKPIRGEHAIPVIFFPLLTVKPPMTFVEFMVMAIFIKTREYRFCRHGKTRADYRESLKTNRRRTYRQTRGDVILSNRLRRFLELSDKTVWMY